MIPFKSYMEQILKEYPKIDQEEIITGLYTFINTIKIKHPDAVLANIPSKDTTYHQLEFIDANNATIGSISFKRYSNANDGIVFNLNGKEFAIKISDEGHIDLRSSYPLCGFVEGTDEVATTKYVLDAVENKASLINTSIMEYITSALNDLSDDINQRINNLHVLITNEYKEYIANLPETEFPEITFPDSIFSKNRPTRFTTLFEGNLGGGDITLTEDFTNYDVLLFLFGAHNHSSTTDEIYLTACPFIPVWMLKNLVVKKKIFGLNKRYFEIARWYDQFWGIDLTDSTTTKLAYGAGKKLKLWKVIGFKLAKSDSDTSTETNENDEA